MICELGFRVAIDLFKIGLTLLTKMPGAHFPLNLQPERGFQSFIPAAKVIQKTKHIKIYIRPGLFFQNRWSWLECYSTLKGYDIAKQTIFFQTSKKL